MRRLTSTLWLLTATTAALVACQGGNNVKDPISDWPHGHAGAGDGPISDWPDHGTDGSDVDEPPPPSEGELDAGAEGPTIVPGDEVDLGGLLPPRSTQPEVSDEDAAQPDAGTPDSGVVGDASVSPDAGVEPH